MESAACHSSGHVLSPTSASTVTPPLKWVRYVVERPSPRSMPATSPAPGTLKSTTVESAEIVRTKTASSFTSSDAATSRRKAAANASREVAVTSWARLNVTVASLAGAGIFGAASRSQALPRSAIKAWS